MTSTTIPRWLPLLQTYLPEMPMPTYVLATADARARTVVHRDILTHADSPLLTTTTDIRTPKVAQLGITPASEAVFYFPRANAQLRIRAHTYALPAPEHPSHASFPSHRLGKDVAWDALRLEAFDALSPFLRASFARPPPGTPLHDYEASKAWPNRAPARAEAGTPEEKALVERALANFALVVLDPIQVDMVELAVVPNRRTLWTKTEREGKPVWDEQLLVP
ncbi:hypothetical protein M422DRAFT_64306 [Sphaerobolus stellatus SS14]|nr:hypothetical protein M422DRAFT_64306 [Sphaerobolus stellatus SS14]